MITQETAAIIWQCYREIEAAKKLLVDMEEKRKQYPDQPYEQKIKDAFGRAQDLQLGIPSGERQHTLYAVSPKLAESVIRAHIATKEADLVTANERARIEMEGE